MFRASRRGAQKSLRVKSKVQDTGAALKSRERADEIGMLDISFSRNESHCMPGDILVSMMGLDVV